MAEHAEPEAMSDDNPADASSVAGAAGAGEDSPRSRLDATQAFATPEPVSEGDAARLVEILDKYLAGLKAGQAPDRKQLLADHPELAEPLQACLAGLEFIHSASDSSSVASPQTLGDFRIIREVGRGGMGAVFEAEQISLGRRVALKILRFGGVSDPEAIQRFQREAETVARLHHTNIVPIFAVGSEQGVNYYAMQFIDGKSLDQVLRERTERGESIPADTVAEWGLEAAEALAHAHARGVIHRDVKPSNLLIDNEEGRIWLTDFGLAKRLDDVTLSMTGALLGTPRYMSPEQAAATHNQLDHRTDIYSLGASLYELVTGQPVFRGNSPHNVISQILSVDPDPPRKYCSSLPRDLETILMKCLSKDAAHRYDSARQLADDLRAFLDGRPIAARRANVVEQATRWIKRQRRSVTLAAGAVAATLLLVTLVTAGGYAWKRSRLAMLMLKTDNPPLVAELLRSGTPVVPPVTVPTQRRIEVPAGEYQLRVSGDSRLSQNFDLTLEPGQSFDHKVGLDDQMLWMNVNVDRSYRLAGLRENTNASPTNPVDITEVVSTVGERHQAVVIELTVDGIRCLYGRRGNSRWEINLAKPTHEILKEDVSIAWPWDRYGNGYDRGLGAFDGRPWVVSDDGGLGTSGSRIEGSFDFNDDGVSDILLAARHQAWLIAISGRDGEPLWLAARGEAADSNAPFWNLSGGSAVVYPPLPVGDQDGDGVADVVTTFISKRDHRTEVDRWIELISGSSGETIWRYDLPADLFALAAGEEVPYELQWFYGQSGGYSSSGGSHSVRQHYRVRLPSNLSRSGPHEYLPTQPRQNTERIRTIGLASASATSSSGNAVPPTDTIGSDLVCVAGKYLIRLQLNNGRAVERSPQDTGVRTMVQPRYGDFDGDGNADVLLLEQLPNRASAGGGTAVRRLTAWSMAKRTQLWQREIEASEPRQDDLIAPIPEWPLVTDLDGDGVTEVIVPDASAQNDWSSPPWGRLAVLDGHTGQPRWHRQLFNVDQQLHWFVDGPDIDGDGVREIFVTTQWGDAFELFVDCLSGSDGKTLWRLEQPLLNQENESGELRIVGLSWYEASGGDWPQLVVSTRRTSGDADDRIVFVSAGTGEMTHMAGGITQSHQGDIDADGVVDLIQFQRTDLHNMHNGGELHVFRGVGRQAWRKIIQHQVMVGDLDGDGVGDVVNQASHSKLEAYSGSTGVRIWRTQLDTDRRQFSVYPAAGRDVRHDLLVPSEDLNDDGVADLLVPPTDTSFQGKQPLLVAISGSDGRLLWETDFTVQRTGGPLLLECRDLDGDGESEIVLAAATDYGLPEREYYTGTNDPRLWLTVLSGRNGQIRWSRPLSETQPDNGAPQFELRRIWLEAAYADLDDDGTSDLVLPAQRSADSDRLDMRAISGRDGRDLWSFPLPPFQSPREAFSNVMPASAEDLDGDGQTEVAVLAIDRRADGQGNTEHVVQLSALRGASGEPLWQWQMPCNTWGNEVDQNAERVKNRVRPLPVRRAGGKHWIAVAVWNDVREIAVLDERGNVVSQRQGEKSFDGTGRRLWTIDADGDGNDELVFMDDSQLCLLSPERLKEPIWTRDSAESNRQRVLGILPNESSAGRIVVLGGNGDHSLRGLDPTSGRTEWTCVGPTAEGLPVTDDRAVLLNAPTDELPPHVLYQLGGQAVARRGSLLHDTADTWRTFARRHPTLAPNQHDSRLLRPLPWKPADYEWKAFPSLLAWSAFYGITLAGVPMMFAVWMIRRRRWGMKTMLMLPVVAVVVIIAFLIRPEDRDFHSPWNKLLIAFTIAGPVMFALAAFARWLMHGYWRRVVVLLATAFLIAIALMAISLFVIEPAKSNVLQPGERYAWDGWYFLFVPVLYAMSWLLVAAVTGASLVRSLRRWLTPRSPQELALGRK